MSWYALLTGISFVIRVHGWTPSYPGTLIGCPSISYLECISVQYYVLAIVWSAHAQLVKREKYTYTSGIQPSIFMV